MTTAYFNKTKASITIEGTSLAAMEEEARKQFDAGFEGKHWELTNIAAHLDLIQVGTEPNDWLPGMWHATYEATEL